MAEGVHPIPELSYFVSTLLEILVAHLHVGNGLRNHLVSTLLEILAGTNSQVQASSYTACGFQPFLRFWMCWS